MGGIEFEEDTKSYGTSASPGVTRTGGYNTPVPPGQSKMVRWLTSHGLSPKSANVVLLAIVLMNCAIIFCIFKFLL